MSLFGGSKIRTKRIEPPARKLGNTLLSIEGVRGLAGLEGPGDILNRQRLRSQALQDVSLHQAEAMRGLGERGIESPGMYERLVGMREGALGNLIAARNEAIAKRRAGAIGILQNLMRDNQPYQQTRVHQSGMSKAAPFIKMGMAGIGGALGSVIGGPAGAIAGSEAGMGLGKGMEDSASAKSAGTSQTAGGGIPGTPYGSPNAQMPGQEPAEFQDQEQRPSKWKLGLRGGLMGLTNLFGGM